MDKDYGLENRQYVIGGIAIFIVVVYIIRLFTLQIMSDDYKKNADSNALLKKVEYPARGVISDRNGRLLVYNQSAYDIMVVMNEEKGRLDTLDFCESLGITREYFDERMAEIKDRNKNPGYSPYTQQMFMSQLTEKEFSIFQEKIYRFPGFYVRRRSVTTSRTILITSSATTSANKAWRNTTKSSCAERKVSKSCCATPTDKYKAAT